MSKAMRGFSLVELVVVVVVIGVLGSIVASTYNGARERAQEVSVVADAKALEEALTAMQLRNGGVLSFGDIDMDGFDDGFYTGDTANCGSGSVLDSINQDLQFYPTGDNCLDVRLADSGKEYCIRSYNPKARNYNTVFNAYFITSLPTISSSDCQYETTLYSGGAIPGAYETVYLANGTFNVPPGIVRLEVAVVGAGGNGNGRCGGGGGGVSTAIINSPTASYAVVVGQPSALGTSGGNAGSSSFGTIVAGGGGNPASGCNVLSTGTLGGTGTTTGGTSQKYGDGSTGGKGGAYLIAGALPAIAATATGTGGGGYGGSSSLIGGGNGGTGTYGFGGGGGGGKTLLLCSGGGTGGGAGTSAPAGNGVSGCSTGNGGVGSLGGGGGGSGNVGGSLAALGGSGMVRVLACYDDTCNPISTPIP